MGQQGQGREYKQYVISYFLLLVDARVRMLLLDLLLCRVGGPGRLAFGELISLAMCAAILLLGGTYRPFASIALFGFIYFRLEHPPPGAGVGAVAGALPSLEMLPQAKKTAKKQRTGKTEAVAALPPPVLGADGALERGRAYVVIFFNPSPGCVKALPKVEAMARRIHAAAGSWFHTVLVSASSRAELDGFNERWAGRMVPMAHDATAAAYEAYIERFGVLIVPHAFVIDRSGTILWHGQSNRRELSSSVVSLIKEYEAEVANKGTSAAGSGTKATAAGKAADAAPATAASLAPQGAGKDKAE